MDLSVKEKEKYVLKLREEGKTYRDIAHELLISPREISKILKKANGEMEEKERKKIVLSNTAKAFQLFKKGKSPTEVVIKLDLSPQEAQSLYLNYLSLNNHHHFTETFKQFDNDSLQDIINLFHLMKQEGIDKKEIVINNIINSNENPDSEFFLGSYEEKIAQIAADTLQNFVLEINTNNILNS